MYRGNHPARVDEKGRLKLPAEFKRQIDELYADQKDVWFYITSRDGKVAEIHALPEWEKFEAKLAAIPSFNPAKKKLLDRLNYYGQMAKMDEQGRVLVPQILREQAKVMGDVVVFGMQNYLEVANHESFRQNMEANPLTEQDEQSLAAYGL
ncbi:division/cell wall cluster transcriptional repressor MraZ [Acidipila sp. EB88]|uniref:division/cell wall cluster transcriptional repressor MraZ n=1 Tax=Acidipila sp. EB88 TaxID=2305226 RepID=UPI000F5E8D04|nr:division/cell wall cluster transcriptional repressor MraZ [Acidipila sp. EB88]RRA48866.1 division/cell wall cluster transcriptional repressor MraZ [Acidipila sp. EB88]